MIIIVASLTLRFYESDGWTEGKVRKLLVNQKMRITRRPGNKLLGTPDYFACYEESGYKVFKSSEIKKHAFRDNQNFGGIDWYINEDK